MSLFQEIFQFVILFTVIITFIVIVFVNNTVKPADKKVKRENFKKFENQIKRKADSILYNIRIILSESTEKEIIYPLATFDDSNCLFYIKKKLENLNKDCTYVYSKGDMKYPFGYFKVKEKYA